MSLCADCFAVSACSSVTLKSITRRSVLRVSLVFALVQTLLLLAGWGFGDIFVGSIGKVAPVVGFLLLLYVGGSMLLEAFRGGEVDARDLNGMRNILLGAVATSIDALAVGISMSMDGDGAREAAVKAAAVFLVTVLSVVLGIAGGHRAGKRYGRAALWVGGTVLVLIGLNILLGPK